jgi:hypothetical protein
MIFVKLRDGRILASLEMAKSITRLGSESMEGVQIAY